MLTKLVTEIISLYMHHQIIMLYAGNLYNIICQGTSRKLGEEGRRALERHKVV